MVTEIERTKRAAEGLRAGNPDEFGKLMIGSHQSLSQKYSCPAPVGRPVEIARSVDASTAPHARRLRGAAPSPLCQDAETASLGITERNNGR